MLQILVDQPTLKTGGRRRLTMWHDAALLERAATALLRLWRAAAARAGRRRWLAQRPMFDLRRSRRECAGRPAARDRGVGARGARRPHPGQLLHDATSTTCADRFETVPWVRARVGPARLAEPAADRDSEEHQALGAWGDGRLLSDLRRAVRRQSGRGGRSSVRCRRSTARRAAQGRSAAPLLRTDRASAARADCALSCRRASPWSRARQRHGRCWRARPGRRRRRRVALGRDRSAGAGALERTGRSGRPALPEWSAARVRRHRRRASTRATPNGIAAAAPP